MATSSLSRYGGGVPNLFDDFRREMDSTLSRFFGRNPFGNGEFGQGDGSTSWFSPSVNVAETENEYEIAVDLPGLKPEDFHVELRHGELWITGERREEHEDQQKNWHHVERRYGQFRRVIPLGAGVDPKDVSAEYKDGVLKVTVPKPEAAKPQRITVKG